MTDIDGDEYYNLTVDIKICQNILKSIRHHTINIWSRI